MNLMKKLILLLSLLCWSQNSKSISINKILPALGAIYSLQDITTHVIPEHFVGLKNLVNTISKNQKDANARDYFYNKTRLKKELLTTANCLTFDLLVLSASYYLYKKS